MTLDPLQIILKDLEESIKQTVKAHRGEPLSPWLNMLQRLDSTTTLSVYSDSSVIASQFHFGVCIAGIHTCRLYGTTLTTKFPEYSVLGEIQSIEFAIQCLERCIGASECDAVKPVAVFSDVEDIQRLLNFKTQRMHQPILEAVLQLNRSIKRFSDAYPAIRLRINFLGNAAQRVNIYYQAAHKVARNAARANSKIHGG
jgi:hypothetical protein